MNKEEFRESFVHTKGEFGGLGIEITMEEGLVKVISPIEGTPAERAGLKAGDLISHVDGEPVKGKTLIQAVRKMRGRPGTQITLMIKRKGSRGGEDLQVSPGPDDVFKSGDVMLVLGPGKDIRHLKQGVPPPGRRGGAEPV